jgi:hypothetical protein
VSLKKRLKPIIAGPHEGEALREPLEHPLPAGATEEKTEAITGHRASNPNQV